MKNRTIPFGYMMRNGELKANPIEAEAVKNIFSIYLNGASLTTIAKHMSSGNVPYNSTSSLWNKNMVKRILENEKYLGSSEYPQIIDEETFRSANESKKMKAEKMCDISDELKAVRELTFCAECGHRLSRIGGNSKYEKWDCRNPECSRFEHRITDNMLVGVIVNTLNTVIANPDLLDRVDDVSTYNPNIEVTRQQNEINRLMDSTDVDYDKAKEEIFKLASLKYECCTYNNKPHKTEQLKSVLADREELNTLDIGLLRTCIARIEVSHFYTINIEFINGITLKNIVERSEKNGCNNNSGETANDRES